MARCLCLAGASIDSKNQEGVAAEVKIIIIIIMVIAIIMIIVIIILALIIIPIRFVPGCRATQLSGIYSTL